MSDWRVQKFRLFWQNYSGNLAAAFWLAGGLVLGEAVFFLPFKNWSSLKVLTYAPSAYLVSFLLLSSFPFPVAAGFWALICLMCLLQMAHLSYFGTLIHPIEIMLAFT